MCKCTVYRSSPSFLGRRLQHTNAEMTTAVKLEKGKDMEAGLVAFQNEKYFYKFVLKQSEGKYLLNLSAPSPLLNEEIMVSGFKPGKYLYLKLQVAGSHLKCFYSLHNKNWKVFGNSLDASQLCATKAGGFVGVYFGLYAFSESQATAIFDWASYQKVN